MTTYSPECFKLRCMNVNWRLSQMALETAALCISQPLFQDLSQRKRITSRTPKMIQLWFDLRDFNQAMGWVQHTDLTIFHMPMHCTSCQWQRTCFSTCPGFHIRCFYAFSAFPHHHPVLEFGGSNHHHLWTYSIQSLALLRGFGEVDALEMACWGEETKMDD